MADEPKPEEPSFVVPPRERVMIHTVNFAIPHGQKLKLTPEIIADIEKAVEEGMGKIPAYCYENPSDPCFAFCYGVILLPSQK
jgi:hypothetical protein